MSTRTHFVDAAEPAPKLMELIERTRDIEITKEMYEEQRISFAYGMMAMKYPHITKDDIRWTAENPHLIGRRQARR